MNLVSRIFNVKFLVGIFFTYLLFVFGNQFGVIPHGEITSFLRKVLFGVAAIASLSFFLIYSLRVTVRFFRTQFCVCSIIFAVSMRFCGKISDANKIRKSLLIQGGELFVFLRSWLLISVIFIFTFVLPIEMIHRDYIEFAQLAEAGEQSSVKSRTIFYTANSGWIDSGEASWFASLVGKCWVAFFMIYIVSLAAVVGFHPVRRMTQRFWERVRIFVSTEDSVKLVWSIGSSLVSQDFSKEYQCLVSFRYHDYLEDLENQKKAALYRFAFFVAVIVVQIFYKKSELEDEITRKEKEKFWRMLKEAK